MDAKPQRPRGPVRMRDENVALPQAAPLKTLHQRNKSTPAFSTLQTLQQGINANPPKRAAFADLSNFRKSSVAPVKDDLAVKEKGTEKVDIKLAKEIAKDIGQEEVQPKLQPAKSAALLRRAQRPLSAAIQKSALPTFGETFAAALTKYIPEPHTDANIGKPLVKRQPTAWEEAFVAELTKRRKDPALDAHFEKLFGKRQTTVFNDSEIVLPNLGQETRLTAPAIPIPQSVAAPVEKALPARAEAVSEPVVFEKDINGVSLVPEEPQKSNPQAPKTIAPPAYTAPVEILPPPSYTDLDLQASIFEQINSFQTKSDDLEEEFLPALETQVSEIEPPKEAKDGIKIINAPSPAVDEVDEEVYWEEDEDGEFFDAQGYKTGHSIRSLGDTTGGMTVFCVPRMTVRVERELAAARVFVESTRSEEDIEDENWDTSMVAEYGDEIFQYMKDLEDRMRPNPYYMDNQAEIQWSMRAVLIDWLVQVHTRFNLLPETLFLAVNYIDRFLSCKIVSLGKLQLVGATALFVAAKYEEINCPSVQEMVFMVDGGYTMEEVLKAERFMLSMLQFELGWPGPMSFLRRISKADDYDLETRTLAKYFLEVTIMDERFVACAPSYTAAACHCLARLMLRKGDWGLAHIHYSQYTFSQLRQLVVTILDCCHDARKHHAAVFEKYTDKRFKKASLFVQTELGKDFLVPLVKREQTLLGFREQTMHSFCPSWRTK